MARAIRPRNLEGLLEAYLGHLRRGILPLKAAEKAKVNPKWVRERRRLDPEFAEDEQDAIGRFAEDMEQILIDAAQGKVEYTDDEDGNRVKVHKDTQAATAWLKARAFSIWNPSPTLKVEHKHTLELTELFSKTDELRAKLERRRELMQPIIDAEVVEDGD